MKDNRLQRRLNNREVAYGIVAGWADPDIVEAAGTCGFDFVFVDAEHGALGIRDCASLVRASSCENMATLIRVPYGDIRGAYVYLDTGAAGLIFPHIKSAADARDIVAASMFPPEGTRGALSSSRAARYGTAWKPLDYYRAANSVVWALPLVEDLEGISNLDEILGVPGIRGLFIGPGDLAVSQVRAGDTSLPAVDSVVRSAIAKGLGAGKVIATVAGTPAAAAALVDQGVRIIAVGATALFTGACRSFLDNVPRSASSNR